MCVSVAEWYDWFSTHPTVRLHMMATASNTTVRKVLMCYFSFIYFLMHPSFATGTGGEGLCCAGKGTVPGAKGNISLMYGCGNGWRIITTNQRI